MKKTPWLLALGVFAFLWVRPAYTVYLRGKLAAALPAAWSAEPMNGGYAMLVPELMATRLHDEALYASRVNQVLIHGKPYNPYWREERAARSWLHQSLAMYVLAAFGWLCRGDLNCAWLLAVAVLGALWALLFHRVFFWWTGKDEVAVPLALFSILFPDVYFWLLDVNFSPAVNFERWADVFFQHHAGIRPNFYRLPSDFLTVFALSLLFLGAWRLLSRAKDQAGRAFALGLAFGALAWVHAYEHVFGLATLGVLTLWVLVKGEAAVAKRNALWLFGGALTGSAAYAWVMAWAVDKELARETLDLIGLEHSRHFFLVSLIHPALAMLGAWKLARETSVEKRWAWVVLASSQLGIFACRNAQVVVGVMIQPFHFIPLGSFTGALMLMLCLAELLAGKAWWDRRLARSAGVAVALLALSNEIAAAERTYRMMGLPKTTQDALSWVRTHVETDGLVMSLSAEANQTLPLYTSAKVQVSPPDGNHSSPFLREIYYRHVAGLLKTLEADPGTFLRDRWLDHRAKNALLGRIGQETRLLGRIDPEALEPAMWFYPQYAWGESDEAIDEGKARIIELYRVIVPQPRPYWLWLKKGDEVYLKKTPEEQGGVLVYMNPGVKLYAFLPEPITQAPKTRAKGVAPKARSSRL